MGETKWTEEQLSAIETRNSNLLIAAAAGSGKTAVLVERIIRIITDEEEIYIIRNEEKVILGKKGDTISIVAIEKDARGVTLKDLEYPLFFNKVLFFSNVVHKFLFDGVLAICLKKLLVLFLSSSIDGGTINTLTASGHFFITCSAP